MSKSTSLSQEESLARSVVFTKSNRDNRDDRDDRDNRDNRDNQQAGSIRQRPAFEAAAITVKPKRLAEVRRRTEKVVLMPTASTTTMTADAILREGWTFSQ